MKDRLLLIFWGIVAGAVFVGGILCFGQLVNWLTNHQMPIDGALVKSGLLLVIYAMAGLIYKSAGKWLSKVHISQAEQFFSPDYIKHIMQAPLGKAIIEQREDIIEQLRFLPSNERQRTVNAPIYKGLTALHIAAALGLTKFCKLLYKYGANTNARDVQGQTPLDLAKRNGFAKTSACLKKILDKYP